MKEILGKYNSLGKEFIGLCNSKKDKNNLALYLELYKLSGQLVTLGEILIQSESIPEKNKLYLKDNQKCYKESNVRLERVILNSSGIEIFDFDSTNIPKYIDGVFTVIPEDYKRKV